nr:hypothetical protein [Tanacetum cinerariifolium]
MLVAGLVANKACDLGLEVKPGKNKSCSWFRGCYKLLGTEICLLKEKNHTTKLLWMKTGTRIGCLQCTTKVASLVHPRLPDAQFHAYNGSLCLDIQ